MGRWRSTPIEYWRNFHRRPDRRHSDERTRVRYPVTNLTSAWAVYERALASLVNERLVMLSHDEKLIDGSDRTGALRRDQLQENGTYQTLVLSRQRRQHRVGVSSEGTYYTTERIVALLREQTTLLCTARAGGMRSSPMSLLSG